MRDCVKGLIDRGNSSLLIEMSRAIGNVLNEEGGDVGGDGCILDNQQDGCILDIQQDGCILDIQQDEDFYRMDSSITSIHMHDGLCNESVMNEWDLSAYPNLKELTVGDDCIRYVRNVVLSGFACLEKVKIGCNCGGSGAGGRFELVHCDQLKSVKIGSDSCLEWSEFVLKDCSLVKEVSIDDGCFVFCVQAVFESNPKADSERIDLPELTQLKIGREVFKGNEDKDSSFVMKGECGGDG